MAILSIIIRFNSSKKEAHLIGKPLYLNVPSTRRDLPVLWEMVAMATLDIVVSNHTVRKYRQKFQLSKLFLPTQVTSAR